MAIKSFRLVNIQSHQDTTIEVPRTGMVRFVGENNEGKSVLVKIFDATVSATLHRKETRLTLINDDSEEGYFIVEKYEGEKLTVRVHREAAYTFYLLEVPGKDPIKRYLADKGLDELVQRFGFHYNKDREMSLHVYNTYDQLIMVTTSRVTNFDILDEAITDRGAQRALEVLTKTKDDVDNLYKNLSIKIGNSQSAIAALVVHDVEREEMFKKKAKLFRQYLKVLTVPTLPDVKGYPDLTNVRLLDTSGVESSLVDLKDNYDSLLNSYRVLQGLGDITDASYQITKMREAVDAIAKEECPTCGRGWEVCVHAS